MALASDFERGLNESKKPCGPPSLRRLLATLLPLFDVAARMSSPDLRRWRKEAETVRVATTVTSG